MLLAILCLQTISARVINELEYFTGQPIYIELSSYPHIHIAYSIKDDSFFFANSNASPDVFSYDDRGLVTSNGTSHEMTIGATKACVKDKQLTKCGMGDSADQFKISKQQFGFEISYNNKCLTKEIDSKVSLRPCTQTDDQLFDFVPTGHLCMSPEHTVEGRLKGLERYLHDHNHMRGGEVVRTISGGEEVVRRGGMHPADIELLERALYSYMPERSHESYFESAPRSYAPVRDSEIHEQNLRGELYESHNHGYDYIEPHGHGHEYLEPHSHDYHEAHNHNYDLHTHNYESHMAHGHDQHQAMEHKVTQTVEEGDNPEGYVDKKSVRSTPMHTEERKLIPGETTVETRTVPIKVKIRTSKAPTTQIITKEMVKDEEEYDEDTDVDEVEELDK